MMTMMPMTTKKTDVMIGNNKMYHVLQFERRHCRKSLNLQHYLLMLNETVQRQGRKCSVMFFHILYIF